MPRTQHPDVFVYGDADFGDPVGREYALYGFGQPIRFSRNKKALSSAESCSSATLLKCPFVNDGRVSVSNPINGKRLRYSQAASAASGSIDDDDFPGECPYRQLVDRFVGYAFRVNFSHQPQIYGFIRSFPSLSSIIFFSRSRTVTHSRI